MYACTGSFLPPYSPNLNPVEGLWLWLKSNVANNVFFRGFIRLSFMSASIRVCSLSCNSLIVVYNINSLLMGVDNIFALNINN
ncbi:hypothetical protein PPYC2_27295 [Paenibacillus polymyxa]|nr:hypothetical protein PPYC2_27295 [Paenibacillus polymyxa]POR25712.1 hypothetical protein CG775_20335 [Paenibacillus polymyxa]